MILPKQLTHWFTEIFHQIIIQRFLDRFTTMFVFPCCIHCCCNVMKIIIIKDFSHVFLFQNSWKYETEAVVFDRSFGPMCSCLVTGIKLIDYKNYYPTLRMMFALSSINVNSIIGGLWAAVLGILLSDAIEKTKLLQLSWTNGVQRSGHLDKIEDFNWFSACDIIPF